MITKVVPGTLIAAQDANEAASEAAQRMARVIRKRLSDAGRVRIALSGGSTPRVAYRELAGAADIDWSKVEIFFVDERAVAKTDERSNYRMVRESLLEPAKIPETNVAFMDGAARDLEAAARSYGIEIGRRVKGDGGIPAFDLIVFGVGADGHTASLFPASPLLSVTDRFVAAVPAAPGREARLTLTVPVLERTRNAVVLATGAEKHAALERAWQVSGDLSTTPARIVRNIRGGIVWVIDRAAGGLA